MEKKKNVSMAVIKRLPKYHRYLKELMRNDVDRISSKELGEKIGFTASQIRQDLNNFGDFGQQGYGYNVKELYKQISLILGLDKEYTGVIIGAGNLGQGPRPHNHHVGIEDRLHGPVVRWGVGGLEPHAGKGAHAVRDPRLAMNDVALTRLAGQTHELECGGMDVPDAAQQALAGVDGLDEGAHLLGKRHEQEVSERMVVDVGKAMGKGAGDGRRRVLGEGGEALAHVPRGHDVLLLAQQARRAAVIGHRHHRVDLCAHKAQRGDEPGLPRAAADGNRFQPPRRHLLAPQVRLGEVSVRDAHVIVPALKVAPRRLRDGDASVLAARTAHGDGKLGLALRDIAGHHRVQQAEPGVQKLMRLGVVEHEIRHLGVEARQRAHFGIVKRVGQKAHVDHEVRLDGHAVLKAEREHVHVHELLGGELGERGLQALAQRRGAHAARVDDHVRAVADARKRHALALDGVGSGVAARGERVPAAILAVAADEHLVRRLEEHHLAGHLVVAQRLDRVEELIEQALAAQVARHAQVAANAGVDADDLGELQDEARREIIDAVVPHVLECVHGLRAAGAGHAGDDDNVGNAVGELRRGDAVRICHGRLLALLLPM